MFYEKQPAGQQEEYKELLRAVGSLSNIFAESDNPYLYYRSHENIFCRAFDAKNLSREDCSADAEKNRVGIGLKTWVGSNDQKVAEFGDLLPEYEGLTGIDLVRRIAEYRNARISTTIKLHGIREMLYHVVKRKKHADRHRAYKADSRKRKEEQHLFHRRQAYLPFQPVEAYTVYDIRRPYEA